MIGIIASTNRPDSVSSKIAHYLSLQIDSKGVENQVIDLQNLPPDFLVSGLYKNTGKHTGFNKIIDQVDKLEKLIFVIPEYNGSFPGALKIFIDGLRYPSAVNGKIAGLIGISSGTQGGALALSHFTDILNYLNCLVLPNKPRIGRIEKNFRDNKIVDETTNKLVNQLIDELIAI